jgi:hypothetical protein
MFISTPVIIAVELPPDPNNAALLYYQALLLCPEPDAADMDLVYYAGRDQIFKVLCGGELEKYSNFEEQIRDLEKKLKDIGGDPNEVISESKRKLQETVPNPYQIQVYKGNSYFEKKMLYAELKDLKARQENMRGYTPNEKMRKYLKDCRQSIELAQAASEISECDWGLRYSQGLACTMPKLTEIRQFSFLLRTDALLLATDGDFRAALERCLMMRRFARHVGDETVILYVVSKSLDCYTFKCIQFLIGNMEPDVETLTWLKNQLSIEDKLELSYARTLELDFGMTLNSLHDKFSDVLRKQAEENPENKTFKLTDEDFIARGRWLYSNFLSSALEVIDSNMPYAEKYAELERLTDKLKKDAGLDPGAIGLIMNCADSVLKLYQIQVDYQAHFNALKVAIEIYLIRAETEELPKELPDELPMDPYSGEDFGYEITDAGFALRCQGEEYLRRKNQFLEFKVQK